MNKAKLIKKTFLTDEVIEFTFETPEIFEFQAGQYISVKINDSETPCFRAYSLSSAPEANSRNFELCIRLVENGRASTWFQKTEVGDEIEFLGPLGDFLFKETGRSSLFIATGAGVAPFKSMIEDQLKKGNKTDLELIFGLRYPPNIFYQDFFNELSQKYPNFHYEITLSRPENDWRGKSGRVTSLLEKRQLDGKNLEIYICGLKDMVEDVTALLKEKKIPEESINFEKYN